MHLTHTETFPSFFFFFQHTQVLGTRGWKRSMINPMIQLTSQTRRHPPGRTFKRTSGPVDWKDTRKQQSSFRASRAERKSSISDHSWAFNCPFDLLNDIKSDIEPRTHISHAVPALLKSFTTLQVPGTRTFQTPVGCFSTLCEQSHVKCAQQPQLG